MATKARDPEAVVPPMHTRLHMAPAIHVWSCDKGNPAVAPLLRLRERREREAKEEEELSDFFECVKGSCE